MVDPERSRSSSTSVGEEGEGAQRVREIDTFASAPGTRKDRYRTRLYRVNAIKGAATGNSVAVPEMDRPREPEKGTSLLNLDVQRSSTSHLDVPRVANWKDG
ncbi:hypothetical protein KM043_003949 [Ampulex compressa]|nr:hypothetical protein KM043_003949 [Ampulex compressa]